MFKLFVPRPLCESSLFVLGFMAQMESSSLLSASRLRRLRAKAVKQKMFTMSSEGGGGSEKLEARLDFLTKMVADISVRLSNACVYVPVWNETVWAEPGMSQWHSKTDMHAEVLATGPADYVSLASFTEAGAGKADDITVDVSWESVAETGDLFSIRAASVCGGCWETLPDICRCGAVRMCGECADVFVATGAAVDVVAERGFGRADGESGDEDGRATEEVTEDIVRLELQRMAENVERMGSLSGEYERLLERIGHLEVGGAAAEFQAELLEEHSGYTDESEDDGLYGYYDGDGNYIESEDEHAE